MVSCHRKSPIYRSYTLRTLVRRRSCKGTSLDQTSATATCCTHKSDPGSHLIPNLLLRYGRPSPLIGHHPVFPSTGMGRKPQVSKKKKMPLGSWATLLPLVLGHTPVFGFCVVRHGVTCTCFNFHLFLVSGGSKSILAPGTEHATLVAGQQPQQQQQQQHPCLVKGMVVCVLNTAQNWMSPGQSSQTKKLRAVTCVALPPQLLPKKFGRCWDGNVRKMPYRAKSNGLSNGRRTLPTAQIRATMVATEFDLGSVEENQPVYSQNRSGLSSTGLISKCRSHHQNGDPGVHGQRALSNGPKAREKRVLGQGRGKAKGQSKGNAKGGKARGKGREQNADEMETWGAGSHAPAPLL